VDAEERKRILGEGGVRGENVRERAERRVLEHELEGAPYRGRRIASRPQYFHRSAEGYVASRGGPLPYMLRMREIASETAAHERLLEARWRELALAHRGAPGSFARVWTRVAERWDFGSVNDLIDRHNCFYPVEARLPMDVRRRDFALVNGEPYSKEPLDAAWVLERFPASLEAASAAA
jgi:hypothetical protein